MPLAMEWWVLWGKLRYKVEISLRDLLTHRINESEAYKNRDPFIRRRESSTRLFRIQK